MKVSTPAIMLVIAATILMAMGFVGCDTGGETNDGDTDGAITCVSSNDCPGGWICRDKVCSDPNAADGDVIDTDNNENPVTDGDISDKPELVVCDFACCTDAECVPPSWQLGDPAWHCSQPGTGQARCVQDPPPCTVTCCGTPDCILNNPGNPNQCTYFHCEKAGTVESKCVQDLDCVVGKNYCSIYSDTPWAYDLCVMGNDGCLDLEPKSCDLIDDCMESLTDNSVECVYSGRCRTDATCIYPKKCEKEDPADMLGVCRLPVVENGEPCAEGCVEGGNCVYTAQCNPGADPKIQCAVNGAGLGYCRPIVGTGETCATGCVDNGSGQASCSDVVGVCDPEQNLQCSVDPNTGVGTCAAAQ